MAVEDLTQNCDITNKKITTDEPKPPPQQQQLLNDNKPIISSKRLTHSGHNRHESSFRIYYGANNGDISVPFNWESHPGTPKQTIATTSNSNHNRRGKSNHSSPSRTNKTTSFNPPLTPPPSYQVKKLQATHASSQHPTDNITGSTHSPKLSSKININHFLSTALPRRFILLKNSSSSNASGTTTNSSVVDPPHSRSSSSSSPRTSLSSLWAASGSESSSGTYSPRTTPVDVVQGRKSRRRTWGGDMDQPPVNGTGAGKQVVNRRSFSTVDSDDDEDPQCSSSCFGTPSAVAYTSAGYRGGGHTTTTTVKKAILSVVSCRVMRSSHHHVDYVV